MDSVTIPAAPAAADRPSGAVGGNIRVVGESDNYELCSIPISFADDPVVGMDVGQLKALICSHLTIEQLFPGIQPSNVVLKSHDAKCVLFDDDFVGPGEVVHLCSAKDGGVSSVGNDNNAWSMSKIATITLPSGVRVYYNLTGHHQDAKTVFTAICDHYHLEPSLHYICYSNALHARPDIILEGCSYILEMAIHVGLIEMAERAPFLCWCPDDHTWGTHTEFYTGIRSRYELPFTRAVSERREYRARRDICRRACRAATNALRAKGFPREIAAMVGNEIWLWRYQAVWSRVKRKG